MANNYTKTGRNTAKHTNSLKFIFMNLHLLYLTRLAETNSAFDSCDLYELMCDLKWKLMIYYCLIK